MKFLTTIFIATVLIFTFTLVVDSTPALAQNSQRAACEGAGGTWTGGECRPPAGGRNLGDIIKGAVDILLVIIGAASVIMLIVGGLRYVFSGGDSNALQGARNTIIYALVGIVVAFAAYAIVNFLITEL